MKFEALNVFVLSTSRVGLWRAPLVRTAFAASIVTALVATNTTFGQSKTSDVKGRVTGGVTEARTIERATSAARVPAQPASPASARTEFLPPTSLAAATTPHNILFGILDDVGSDQLSLTNPSGVGLPNTPTIDAIAAQGVNFTDCWSMPECSPSRVSFFTGRFPGRTGVGSPLTQETLAQSQCSPYEMTTPRVLDTAGYRSALFGKFHLAQNEFNPYGIGAPASVGFTRFNGTLLGAPPYIDPTIAGQVTAEANGLSCGFPVSGNEPAICACAFPDGTCESGVDALDCLVHGGVPLVASDGTPIEECDPAAVARIDWGATNANYAWPRTINWNGEISQTIPARVHADTDQAELAAEFILAQKAEGNRWMCSLSFTGDHDPWQPLPPDTLPPGATWPAELPLVCEAEPDVANPTLSQRRLSNQTIESMDTQIRRVLVGTGLATFKRGKLELASSDTLIVIVGDNGSFLTTVQAPFNPTRAKATAYQTGVSVPLVVAGGPVVAPGRSVHSMVNVVDLFQLFGEAAGIDVRDVVPEGRKLDCRPMMPYLINPLAESQRNFNFTQYTEPILAVPCYPCLIAAGGETLCSDTFLSTQQLCEAQGGVWYGPTDDGQPAFATDCCELWEKLNEPSGYGFVYPSQWAMTDGRYKLIGNELESCGEAAGANALEFYDLSECFAADQLFGHGIDNPAFDLLASGKPLAPEAQLAYQRLLEASNALFASMAQCIGDINMNGFVGAGDLAILLNSWGEPSVADLNNDGITNGPDLTILLDNFGSCSSQ